VCCTWLAGNAGPKNAPKIRHLGTIAQVCRAISSQIRNVLTIGKKTVEYQYLFHMSSQYGELRSTSCWDLLASLWHSTKFQRISGFGSVNLLYGTLGVGVNKTAALSRGRQLYSALRPSRWAMAHIVVVYIYIYLCYHYYLPTHILFLQCVHFSTPVYSQVIMMYKYCISYVHRGGCVIVIVCVSVSNFAQKKLLNGFAWNFQEGWQWTNEQMIKCWWQSGPYHDTGKMRLGAHIHCLSADSNIFVLWALDTTAAYYIMTASLQMWIWNTRWHCVRWGSSSPEKGHSPPIFSPCPLWPTSWMD